MNVIYCVYRKIQVEIFVEDYFHRKAVNTNSAILKFAIKFARILRFFPKSEDKDPRLIPYILSDFQCCKTDQGKQYGDDPGGFLCEAKLGSHFL